MTLSVKQIAEALRLRRQIDALEKRLARILGTTYSTGKVRGRMGAATRAKRSAAARARWARLKGTVKKKSAHIPASGG